MTRQRDHTTSRDVRFKGYWKKTMIPMAGPFVAVSEAVCCYSITNLLAMEHSRVALQSRSLDRLCSSDFCHDRWCN